MSNLPKTPLVRGFLLALAVIALSGCKPKDIVSGSPEPPESYGARSHGAGCPRLAGVYAWPPVEGAPQGYKAGGVIENYRAAPDLLALTLGKRGTIHVQDDDQRRKKELMIESRITDENVSPVHRISKRRFMENQFRCTDGWVVIAEYTHPRLEARDEYGGPVSMGAKLTTLANGDLAIGQWRRIHGGKGGLFQWGDSPSGNWLPLPDNVKWYWSRYERVAP